MSSGRHHDHQPTPDVAAPWAPVTIAQSLGEVLLLAEPAHRHPTIATLLDEDSREQAPNSGGTDRQKPRDWLIQFNEKKSDGLVNIPSLGDARKTRRWCAAGPAI
jgi:hypothetical protein